MFRVVVADDHALVRESVTKAVRTDPDVDVVAEATDGAAALELARTHEPDAVLLDVAMPKMDGLSVAETLRAEQPDTKIIFLTMHDDDESLRRAISIGAEGFVTKESSIDELVGGIETVRRGGSFLSPRIATRVMDLAARRQQPGGSPDLTKREQEVLGLLARGARPAQIGEKLYLSVKTVKNHLTAVYRKLDVDTAAQAVAAAYRQGLVHNRDRTN